MCFYHLIINETNGNICSYSLATFHKKYAYLKIKVRSIEKWKNENCVTKPFLNYYKYMVLWKFC